MNKPIVTSGATYKLTHRPEGWIASFNLMEHSLSSPVCDSENMAIKSLNIELALNNLHKFRLNEVLP